MEAAMRKIILSMSMSLDGYVASDRQHPGALPEDDELVQWRIDWISGAGAHLMGRKSYQEMARFWPQSPHPYAAPMNDIPKIVFSQTLRDGEATWGPKDRVARGDLATEIAAIREGPGPDVIAWGGASFAGALVAEDLVDEYRLAVQPVAVGSGQALFSKLPAARHFRLVEAKSFACGVVVHIYTPQQGPSSGIPAGTVASEGE
jgi:dihydrofolate reductase